MGAHIGTTSGVVKWEDPLFEVRVPMPEPADDDDPRARGPRWVPQLAPAHEILRSPTWRVRGSDLITIRAVGQIYDLIDRDAEDPSGPALPASGPV